MPQVYLIDVHRYALRRAGMADSIRVTRGEREVPLHSTRYVRTCRKRGVIARLYTVARHKREKDKSLSVCLFVRPSVPPSDWIRGIMSVIRIKVKFDNYKFVWVSDEGRSKGGGLIGQEISVEPILPFSFSLSFLPDRSVHSFRPCMQLAS